MSRTSYVRDNASGNYTVNSDVQSSLQLALFDRVINLKFHVRNPGTNAVKEFVVRSDFECHYPRDNVTTAFSTARVSDPVVTIRKCHYKPEITVQYKQQTSEVMTNIDIYVANFYIMTENGTMLQQFSNDQYKLEQVDIYMGYFSQFEKQCGNKKKPGSVADYMNLHAGNGVSELKAQVLYVTTESFPPDYRLHIHCCVGISETAKDTVEQGSQKVSDTLSFEQLSETHMYKNWQKNKDTYNVKDLCFDLITRKYINTTIYDKRQIPISATLNLDAAGYMDDEAAKKYGIQVFYTESVKNIKKIPCGYYSYKDSKGTYNTPTQWGKWSNVGSNAINTLNNICTQALVQGSGTELYYKLMNDGNFMLFTNADAKDMDTLHKAFTKTGAYNDSSFAKEFRNRLPFIYSINYDALATISCPFFGFLNPFDEIYFANRYYNTQLAGYFITKSVKEVKLYTLYSNISFSTTEDVNEMTITAVPEEGVEI